MFKLKTDKECLSAAQFELFVQLDAKEKAARCFSLLKIIDLNKKERHYTWIKTWKNKPDTIFVYVWVGRGYWDDVISYMDGNQELIQKIGMVDLRDKNLPPYEFDDREKGIVEKYKEYEVCN